MRRKIRPDEFDRITRQLFRADARESEELSPEALFLAGFRQKLRAQKGSVSPSIIPFGELCWKLSPFLAALCVALTVFLFSINGETLATSSEVLASSPTEEILWTLTESASPDLSRDQILQAVLTLEQEGDR